MTNADYGAAYDLASDVAIEARAALSPSEGERGE